MTEDAKRRAGVDPHGVHTLLSKRSIAGVLAEAVTLAVAGWVVGVDPLLLLSSEARGQMWTFVAGGYPPDLSRDYLFGRTLRGGLLWAIVETLAISVIGTSLAVVLASASTVTCQGPLYAGSSASRVAVGYVLHRSARLVLSFLRSVPGLVWGFSSSPRWGWTVAGVLALGVHNAGVLGKLYADFLEDTDPMTTEAVASSGATRFQAVCHGMVPQISATVASYTLYRWECTIRSATILGFVGTGGSATPSSSRSSGCSIRNW